MPFVACLTGGNRKWLVWLIRHRVYVDFSDSVISLIRVVIIFGVLCFSTHTHRNLDTMSAHTVNSRILFSHYNILFSQMFVFSQHEPHEFLKLRKLRLLWLVEGLLL